MNMIPELALMNIGAGGILLIAIGLALAAFQIWMVFDCAVNEASTSNKVAWFSIIIIFSFIGALAYYFARKLPRLLAVTYKAYKEASSPPTKRSV